MFAFGFLTRRFQVIGILLAVMAVYPQVSFAIQPSDTDTTATDTTYNDFQTEQLLRVYLDCDHCDRNFIREEINFINYVRDPEQADIHLFITTAGTGGGGTKYEISFIGQKEFERMSFELSLDTDPNATPDDRRRELVKILKKGLMPYMASTPLQDAFSVQFESPEEFDQVSRTEDDPWNHWTFELYAGSLNLRLESNQKNFGSRWGVYANHVTEDWKIRFRPYFNYHYEEIDQGDDEETVVSRRHRHGINSYAIKSLDQHWSAGIFGRYLTRKDQNIHHELEVGPGAEYSLLPYDEATRKSITFTYRFNYLDRKYYKPTIYRKTSEELLNHSFEIGSSFEQPWGYIHSFVKGSHYLHDFSHARFQIFGNISVRISEGFSVRFLADYQIIRDQLSLPVQKASLEDILLAQQEIQTDYYLYTSIALTYTFGSDFTNVVNTRF